MADQTGCPEAESHDLLEPDRSRAARRHKAARRDGGVLVLDLEQYDLEAVQHKLVSIMLTLGLVMEAADLHVVPDATEGKGPQLRVLYYLDGTSGEARPAPECVAKFFPELTKETRQGDWIVREGIPLPEEITPHVVRLLRWLAGVDSPRGRLARTLRRLANAIDGGRFEAESGRFVVRIGSHKREVLVAVYPSADGDRFILRFGSSGL